MTLDEINEMALKGDFNEFIRVCEARQTKALSRIADAIAARGNVRVVLLAGGSSAGKTTSANRLATQLRVNGIESVHFSTDDYFVGDARNPRDETGAFDYETVEAVDIPRLASDTNALLAGKSVHLRKFDFCMHDGYDAKDETRLPKGAVVIIEGIHALNPRLTEGIDDAVKYRVFVEPATQPEVFFHTCLQTSYARLLRRLVRDNQFRKVSPEETFVLWPKVVAGEKKWIEPFRPLADATFDSSLAYELSVLKPYVHGLLLIARRKGVPDPALLGHLIELMELVTPVTSVSVPGDSILRETIGGSLLDY